MITYETKYGKVNLSNAFFAKLIGHAVTSCYGVAGMVPKGGQKIRNLFSRGNMIDKGIFVSGSIDSSLLDNPLQLGEINTTDNGSDNRHNNIIDKRCYDLAKSTTNYNTDCHINDISSHSKCLKIGEKLTLHNR